MYDAQSLAAMSNSELVGIFNELAPRYGVAEVDRFSSKEAGIRRIEKLLVPELGADEPEEVLATASLRPRTGSLFAAAVAAIEQGAADTEALVRLCQEKAQKPTDDVAVLRRRAKELVQIIQRKTGRKVVTTADGFFRLVAA